MLTHEKTGIPETILKELHQIFSRNIEVEKVLLFGSRSRGDHKSSSDIDLAIEANGLSAKEMNLLEDRIRQIDTAYDFDIVFLDKLKKEQLRKKIKKEGIVIYERGKDFGKI
ncbi:nucleotidyltransferase domain-containing protein [Bacillaceae bacterium]